jgi:hypothetical protein
MEVVGQDGVLDPDDRAQATGPPERAKPEPAVPETPEFESSGEGANADSPEYPA